jgi:hypothetical protein
MSLLGRGGARHPSPRLHHVRAARSSLRRLPRPNLCKLWRIRQAYNSRLSYDQEVLQVPREGSHGRELSVKAQAYPRRWHELRTMRRRHPFRRRLLILVAPYCPWKGHRAESTLSECLLLQLRCARFAPLYVLAQTSS